MVQTSATLKPAPIVLAMTGASGAVYAMRLLEALLCCDRQVHLTLSDSGRAVIKQELQVSVGERGECLLDALQAADRWLSVPELPLPETAPWSATQAHQRWSEGQLHIHHHQDYFTPIASGSFLTAGMVICPCSGSTLSGIAHAASQNLIQRAAEVHLKERRKLIVVPRETPVSSLQLENMLRVAHAGAVVLPASPGWYHGVSSLLDLVDFVVARILDQLDIRNAAIKRWQDAPP